MYLIILSNGMIFKVSAYDDNDIRGCDSGCMMLVNIRNHDDLLSYGDGEWKSIKRC